MHRVTVSLLPVSQPPLHVDPPPDAGAVPPPLLPLEVPPDFAPPLVRPDEEDLPVDDLPVDEDLPEGDAERAA